MFVETKKEGEALIKLEPWRQRLLDGADFMEKHGKCIGYLGDSDGRVCMVGALIAVVRYRDGRDVCTQIAINALAKRIGPLIGEWSDNHSIEEATEVMRACARS